MRRPVENIAALILGQKEILEDILRLAYEMRTSIVDADIESLDSLVREEFRALQKLKAAKDRLSNFLSAVSVQLGLKGDAVSLRDVIGYLSSDERSVVVPLHDGLRAVLCELVEIGGDNRELIESHLENTDAMINLLSMTVEIDPLNNLYGADGTAPSEKRASSGLVNLVSSERHGVGPSMRNVNLVSSDKHGVGVSPDTAHAVSAEKRGAGAPKSIRGALGERYVDFKL